MRSAVAILRAPTLPDDTAALWRMVGLLWVAPLGIWPALAVSSSPRAGPAAGGSGVAQETPPLWNLSWITPGWAGLAEGGRGGKEGAKCCHYSVFTSDSNPDAAAALCVSTAAEFYPYQQWDCSLPPDLTAFEPWQLKDRPLKRNHQGQQVWLCEPRIKLLGHHSPVPTHRSFSCPVALGQLPAADVPAILTQAGAVSQWLKRRRHKTFPKWPLT